MTDTYVGKTLRLGSKHQEVIDHARTLMPLLVQDEADKRGFRLTGEPAEVRVEYGRMEPTGEMQYDDVEDEWYPETYWLTCPEDEAVYVLLSWEAPAVTP